jgi:hypothetical protein
LTCTPKEITAAREGQCAECGADPQSPLALQIRADIEQTAACPNCGSTHGFGPFRSKPDPLVLLFGAILYLLMAGANVGELQCFKCQYVFRPRSRVREIGCVVVLFVVLAAIAAVVIFRS